MTRVSDWLPAWEGLDRKLETNDGAQPREKHDIDMLKHPTLETATR